jgi:leucyl aminopeptidase
MKYSAISQDPTKQSTDCLIVGLYEKGEFTPSASALDEATAGLLTKLFKQGDLNGKLATTTWIYDCGSAAATRALIVGCGDKAKLNENNLRKIAQAATRAIKDTSIKEALTCLTEIECGNRDTAWKSKFLVEASEDVLYRFDQMKSEKAKPLNLKQLKVAVPKAELAAAKQGVAQGEAVAKGIAVTKDLGNLPGNFCTPTFLAKRAKELGKLYEQIHVTVLDEKEMGKLGMGSLLSVSAGSDEPAKLIVLEYKGGKAKQKPHVLVGKAITFDTGGISLKPGEGMDEMKYDMCGGASVFGTLIALAEMQAPINVVGVIAAAENMPSGRATKPGDVVTSMSGQTIEILNTDAEGRLVLCDALTYVERFEPESVVDIATLTGAIIIALGHHASGLMANDDELAQALLDAGQVAHDRAWQMPLWDDYQPQLDSNFADIQNIGGRPAGSVTAACFLSRFTKKYKWAHLDIAGTAWVSGKEKGASGRPVPLLTQYLLSRIENQS